MAIFSLITTGLGALFGSTVIGNLVGGALAFGAKLGLTKLSQQQQKKQKFTAVQGEVQLGGDVPVNALLGTGKTRGQRLFYAKWGKGNKINADVFALANGWCDGLEPYIYMYGQKYNLVPKAVAGGETARYSVEGFIDGDGNSSIDIRFYDGRPDQVHDAELVASTAALGNTWKATSRLRGVCYVVVYRYYHLKFFRDAGRGRPEIEWMLRGLREYDPTKDSTVAGGNGPQRLNDPSTHVHTLNPAIHRLNYQLGLKGLISGRTLIGEGKTLGQLDLSSYFVAINYCRTLRKAKPIYQCSLWVNSDTDHTEALSAFDDAMAGYGLNRRGLSGVVVGAPQIPVLTITDADIPSDRPKPRQPRKSAFDLFNHLSGQFTSPDSMWNPESLKPIVVNADVAADKRARQTSIDFLQVHDADVAQYLLNIRYRQNRKGGTVTLPVSRRVGLKVMEGEWVTYQGKDWMVSEWRCDADLRFTFVLTETGADIYDDGDIAPGPVVIPPTPPINPSQLSVVQNFNVETSVIAGASGSQVPCLRFTWTPPEDPTIVSVNITYQVVGETQTFSDVSNDPESGLKLTTDNVVSGKAYQAKATITTNPDRFRTETLWVTTAAPTGNLSVLDNSITAAKIADAAVTADKLMNEAVTSLKLANQAVTTAKMQVGAVTEQILANGAVISSKLGDAAVTAQKLADAAVTATKFAAGIKPVEVLSALPATGNSEGRQVYLTTDGKVYRYKSGAWTAEVAAGDISGTLADAQIAAIAASKVTGQMTDAQIAAVAAAKVTGTLVSSQIADLAITNSKLAALAVDAAKLANNAVTTTKIADDAISTPKLQANAVVADKIAANAVTARSLLLADQENLIANGNIEDGSAVGNYWGAVGAGGVIGYLSKATYPDLVQTGTRSIILQKQAGSYGASVSVDMTSVAIFPVTAGEVLYGETAIITNGSPTTAGAYFRVLWLDANQAAIPGGDGVGYADIVQNAPMTANWVTHSRKVTVPANAAFGRVRLYNHNTQTTTQNLIFDRLVLRRANAALLVVDGGILTNHLSAGSVTTAKIAADAVTANELAANAVTAIKISAGAVETAKIAVGAVIADRIAAGAVTTAKLDALAVTSDKLAANSVIAGKIAVGAVAADQIAANAITSGKIAAGAISTDKLAVGRGANYIVNSDLSAGLANWALEFSNQPGSFTFSLRTDTYAPVPGAIQILQTNGNQGVYYGVRPVDAAGNPATYAVAANGWYEFSVYYLGHRCTGVEPYIQWLDAAGAHIGYSSWGVYAANQNINPNKNLANYQRFWNKAQAPNNAAQARIFFRMNGTIAGQSDSYLWLARPFFGEAHANQQEPTPWSPAGVTLIGEGNIFTGAVTADKIAANAITAGKIAAGVVTATELAAGAVTAVKIAAGAVATDKLAANAVTSDKIAANAITAKQLILTDFTNLIANGNFDEGNVTNTWSAVNGGGTFYVLADPQFVQTGAYSAILQKNAGNTGGSIFVDMLPDFDIPVKAGEVLYGETSIRTNEASQAAGAYFRVRWLDASKAEIGISDVVNNAPISGTFTLRSGKVTAPTNAKFARIRLYHHNTSSISNLIFDRLTLRRANAAELIVDGGITADKLNVNSLSAVSGNFGDAYFSGIARSVNGKLLLDFNNGGIEVFT